MKSVDVFKMSTLLGLTLSFLLAEPISAAYSQESGGYGLSFGGNQLVTIPNSPSLNPSRITVECWVRFNRFAYGGGYTGTDAQFPLCKGGDRTPGGYRLMQGGASPSSVWICFAIGPFWDVCGVCGGVPPSLVGHWCHLAGTYDGETLKCYLNGSLLASSRVGATSVTSSSPLYLSYDDVGGFPYELNGIMDEVRVWNYARTREEIRDYMNVRFAGNEAGLVGYWKLDEGQGQVVSDCTMNGNNGYLGSSAGPDSGDPTWVTSDVPYVSWSNLSPCTGNNEIVGFNPGPGGSSTPSYAQGYPDRLTTSLGYEGSLTLLFPCYIIDGPGSDLMVYANGSSDGTVNENYRVEVSADGQSFVSLGESPGDDTAFDLAPTGLSEIRYVRITDLPPDEGAAPPKKGADIDAVVALNTKGLVSFEPTGQIYGTITDATCGTPLDGIVVSLAKPDNVRLSAKSQSGSYDIENVPAGSYELVASDPNGIFSDATFSGAQVVAGTPTRVNFSLSPKEPPKLVVTKFELNDIDNRITMGDHAILHLEITNRGGCSGPVTLALDGRSEMDSYPDLKLFDGSNWVDEISIYRDSWKPSEAYSITCPVYVTVIDPRNLGPTQIIPDHTQLEIRWNDQIINNGSSSKFHYSLQEIYFDSNPAFPQGDYGDLRSCDCLREAGTSTAVRQYAQYAASNADINCSIAEPNEKDPDTRFMAAKNVWQKLVEKNGKGERIEFKTYTKATLERVSDAVLVKLRGGYIGGCIQFGDLSTGLLRALGIETRDVSGALWKVDFPPFEGHQWNEFYAREDESVPYHWIQFDAGAIRFDDPSGYHARFNGTVYYGLHAAKGDRYPLSYYGYSWRVKCMEECRKAICENANCGLCLSGKARKGSDCFEERIHYYEPGNFLALSKQVESEYQDSIEIDLIAPKKALVSVPFQLSVLLKNVSTQTFPNSIVSVMRKTWALDSLDSYSIQPDSILLSEIAPGQSSDTIHFTITPLHESKPSNIMVVVSDASQQLLAIEDLTQSVFNNEGSSALTILGANNTVTVRPSETMVVEARVLNDSLNNEPGAYAYGFFRAQIDTQYSGFFPLIYNPSDSIYHGSYGIPPEAPVGPYSLAIIANHPSLNSDTLEKSFEVKSVLALSISARDSCSALDTVVVRALVRDRSDTLGTASLTLNVKNGTGSEHCVAMVADSKRCFSSTFVPRDHAKIWGNESFNAGAWNLKVTASYAGSSVSDSATLQVSAPDLVIDSSTVSLYPLTPTDFEYLTVGLTIKNQGNEPSDSCFLDAYEALGDSLVPISGGVRIPALNVGDSTRVVMYKSTIGWSGTHNLVFSLDDIKHICDSNRSNNRVTKSVSVIAHVTDVPGSGMPPKVFTNRLEQNYPNPFNPATTIEFEVKQRQVLTLDIFDVRGALVKHLVNRSLEQGKYKISWNGENEGGRKVASGIYFCRIKGMGWESNRKMVLLR